MKKLSGLIFLGVLAGTPGAFAASTHIIGGTTVSPGDPIAATTVAIVGEESTAAAPEDSVLRNYVAKKPPAEGGGGEFVCSGSILADDLIVTAGHCVGPNIKLMIVFRTDAFHGTGPVVQATSYTRPKDFNPNRQKDADDIGLILFSGGLPEGYHPATLLGANDPLSNGEVVTLAGYGIDVGAPPQGSDGGAGILRETTVSIQEAQWGKTEVEVDQTQGRGACHGDSGGPAFKMEGNNLLLFGVTSRGGGECNETTLYTNIVDHVAWLEQAAAQLRGH